jgi:hypothetical protein
MQPHSISFSGDNRRDGMLVAQPGLEQGGETMWMILKLPQTGSEPLGKPHCPYCRSTSTRIYERITKRVKHPELSYVSVVRRKCERCGRTFRHYAPGVSRSIQTATVKALSVLLYSIGLSYSQIVTLLGGHGVKLVKSTVWRSVRPVRKKAYLLHTQSLRGQIRIKGADTNANKPKHMRIFDSVVLDLQEGKGLELQFPDTEKGDSLVNTTTDLSKKIGVEVEKQKDSSSKENSNSPTDSAADAYISRLRKSVRRRSRDLTREASSVISKTRKKKDRDKLQELLNDCRMIGDIVEGKEDSCETDFWEIYKKYAWAKAPHKGETATLWYKMRLFTLRLWDESSRILQQLEASKMNSRNASSRNRIDARSR